MNKIYQKVSEFLSIGYRSILGHLKADGIQVTEASQEIDEGSRCPWSLNEKYTLPDICYKKTCILIKSSNGIVAC